MDGMTTEQLTPPNLTGINHALRGLNHAFQFGKSAEHPGLVDTAAAAAHHMGTLLDQLRDLQRDRLAEITARG